MRNISREKGFTLIELMIVIAIIAIIAAIAIPSLLKSRIAANEASAAASLKNLVSINSTWRQGDVDGDGVKDHHVADIDGFYSTTNNDGDPVKYIDIGLANADATGGTAGATAKSGYYYAAITSDENGNPYSTRADVAFGFCAFPASYNNTGVRTFIVNEEGVVYQQDNSGAQVTQWPSADPTTQGWVAVE